MLELPTTPLPDCALLAAIGDGEFRTYAFVCHLAWRTHPHAEQPYTDLDYEQLARLHPGTIPLTASAVRARINRLVKVGLLRRERINNVCWRTYPTLEASITVGVMQDSTQTASNITDTLPNHTQPVPANSWMLCPITPNKEYTALGVTTDHTQAGESDVSVMAHRTQQAQATNGVLADVAPSVHRAQLDSTSDSTQGVDQVLGVTAHHSQPPQSENWLLPHVTPSHEQMALSAIPGDTQQPSNDVSAMAHNSHSANEGLTVTPDCTQPGPLLDHDLIHDQVTSDQPSDQIMTAGDSQTTAKTMTASQLGLVEALTKLTPQPMSPPGIRECMTQPALTAAWLAYVLDPANGVQKPAAYLRKQVRRGVYPPQMIIVQSSDTVERSDYAAILSASANASPSPSPNQPSPVAVAQGRPTRWPLDAS